MKINKLNGSLLLIFGLILSTSLLVAGDRKIDTDVVYPTGALVQNGGRVINLKIPPIGITPAVGDGVTDDTTSFLDAYNYIKNNFVSTSGASSYILYIPNGTYRVTQSIIYQGAVASVNGTDINNVRFVGQSRAGTIIRLGDNSSAFQSTPVPVIAYQNPTTGFNGRATSNLCENLTVNTGSGNPGAVGIFFMGANSARMSNVSIISGDGKGAYGIWFKIGSVQAYLKDITITGFNSGIYAEDGAEDNAAFEHLTLSGQHVAAVSVLGGVLSLRDLESDQSSYNAPAIAFSGTSGSAVLLDSNLTGGSSTNPAVDLTSIQQEFFARNTRVSGYTVGIMNQGSVVPNTDPFISEYCNFASTTLFSGQDTHSFALPPSDTPLVPWETNLSNWVNVEDYRNGTNSDNVTVQNAFAAAAAGNKTTIYFPKATYNITSSISVPACVTRIDTMFCLFTGGGHLNISNPSSNPVIIVGKGGYQGVIISADRTVIAELWSGSIVNDVPVATHVDTYIESCTNLGAAGCFGNNQNVWARCINNENTSGADLVASGANCHLWIMGFKTETKPTNSVLATGGATAEVLGGYVNMITTQTVPMVQNSGSNISYTASTNMSGGYTGSYTTVISETRGATTATEPVSSLPARGSLYHYDFFIPHYVGGHRPSGPLNLFTVNQDVGTVTSAGSADSYDSSSYFVDGSGAGIGSTADSFQFVNTTWTTPGTLTALVNSIDNTNANAKAALMFRNGTEQAMP